VDPRSGTEFLVDRGAVKRSGDVLGLGILGWRDDKAVSAVRLWQIGFRVEPLMPTGGQEALFTKASQSGCAEGESLLLYVFDRHDAPAETQRARPFTRLVNHRRMFIRLLLTLAVPDDVVSLRPGDNDGRVSSRQDAPVLQD